MYYNVVTPGDHVRLGQCGKRRQADISVQTGCHNDVFNIVIYDVLRIHHTCICIIRERRGCIWISCVMSFDGSVGDCSRPRRVHLASCRLLFAPMSIVQSLLHRILLSFSGWWDETEFGFTSDPSNVGFISLQPVRGTQFCRLYWDN